MVEFLYLNPLPPTTDTLQNLLMKLGRGKYFRSEAQLKKLFNTKFEIEDSGLFPIKLLGFLVGWHVVALFLRKH
jgi:hypothetical protein